MSPLRLLPRRHRCQLTLLSPLVRTLPGSRRFVLLRYGLAENGAYQPSPEVLARLGPEARALVDSEPELPDEPGSDGGGEPLSKL